MENQILPDKASESVDELSKRIAGCNRHIHTFVELAGAAVNTGNGAGYDARLEGICVGVKDIIDVAGLPTRNGSVTCRDAGPASSDAAAVGALRAAGARIVGKTTSTEFAYADPTGCRNPHDTTRSPGGSSSGETDTKYKRPFLCKILNQLIRKI